MNMQADRTRTRRTRSWLVAGALMLTAAWGGATGCAQAKDLVVQAGDHDRAMVPMCVEAPSGIADPKMVDADTNKPVPCQLGDGKLWWILEALPAGKTKTYRVSSGGQAKPVVAVRKGEDKIDLTVGGKAFTTFRFDPEEIRPYCYPLFGPGQVRMTRGYPMVKDIKGERHDHHHHRGFYVAHGEFQQKKYNFWHEPLDGKTGEPAKAQWDRQVVRKPVRAEGGPVFGQIEAMIDWTGHDGTKVLEEQRRLTFYAIDGAARIVDLSVGLNAKYGDVHFGDTKEGGICSIRVAPEIREVKLKDGTGGTGRITNSNGQKSVGAWGKRAKWVDYSRVKGQQYGVAIFDTPGNLRYPTWWHVRNYGLFTANPFGISYFDRKSGKKGDYDLKKGDTLVFRYRLYLHKGDVDGGKVASRYEDYVDPPKAAWK